MSNHFRALYTRTLEDGTKEFVASTAGAKRDGLTLDMRGGIFDSYLANPVVLWCHDYRGERLPVGKCVKLKPMVKELRALVSFDLSDPFAAEIDRKYDEGFLNAVSIGWIDRETSSDGRTVSKWELLDISAVPVPGDPQALLRREYAAIRSLIEEDEPPELPDEAALLEAAIRRAIDAGVIAESEEAPIVVLRGAIPPHSTEKAAEDADWDGPAAVAACPAEAEKLRLIHAWVDPDGDTDAKQSYKLPHHQADGVVVWRGVAAAMARLLQAGTQIPDADRRGVWTHLARHYRQFDKEPPELRSLAEFGPRLAAGAMPNGEWEHMRADLATIVLAKADELKQAIAQLEAAIIPPEDSTQVDPDLAAALSLVHDALKETP